MRASSGILLNVLLLAVSVALLKAQVPKSGGTEKDQVEQKPNDDNILHVTVGGTNDTALSADNNNTDVLNSTITTTNEPSRVNGMPDKELQAQEHKSSMAIFFILFVIVLSILLVHIIIITKFHYIPDSLAIVLLGALIGFLLSFSERNWKEEEALKPNAFFLVLLPPIIFESGYNLNKGNFFANIGSILVFAIVGTAVSAWVVGSGIYILGQADLIYPLSAVNSFAFGSMISAVDPVATLAIFQALNVDSLLYMLVFGESMLNDAVAIVLATTVLELNEPAMASLSGMDALGLSFRRFMLMFFGSAALGVAAGLTSALLLKHVDLRKTPSLEFGVMLVFAYLPYGLAEGVHLSGIMAILFCGITMSHYTHFNLSPMTQITMQQTFRTLAFIAETCTFAYLGMAFFTFSLTFDPVFIIWAILLCFIGRAMNIFPLSFLVNKFRENKISRKNQFVMWFSGLRGAVAFALALHMDFGDAKTQRIMLATTLSIVLFTTVVLGGGAMPLLKILNDKEPNNDEQKKRRSRRKRRRKALRSDKKYRVEKGSVLLSKTQEMNPVLDNSYSELTETDDGSAGRHDLNAAAALVGDWRQQGAARLDARFFRPFFVRKFTAQEKKESTLKLTDLAMEWFKAAPQDSESDLEDSSFVLNAPRSDPDVVSSAVATTDVRLLVVDSSDDIDHRDTEPLL